MRNKFFIGAFVVMGLAAAGMAASLPIARGEEKAVAPTEPGSEPVFGESPRVATTKEELKEIEARPDFAARKAQTIKEAEELIAKPLPVPKGYGGWFFDYANPENGHQLEAIDELHHRDPSTGKIFTDDRSVIAYRGMMHGRLDAAAVTLGWAYAFTGDDRYAAEMKRFMLILADEYASFPDRLDRWGHTGFFAPYGGRRYVQSLDEAYGVIKLSEGYDLCRNSKAWSEEDKKTVETKFFRPTSESLLRFTQPNNHQSWYNAALITIGSVLGDKALVDRVLNMDRGYRDQLNKNIGSDGMWDEGTMAYQVYALMPLTQTADYLRRIGIDIGREKKLRLMILAPLHASYPNGQLPAINDSDRMSIDRFHDQYEWAFKVYKEPLFAQAAAWNNPGRLKELLGADAVAVSPIPMASENLPAGGLAILRQAVTAAGGGTCLFIDYGPHGGGHGHFDKLNLMLYANGREWLLDPGRLSYSNKEYKTWVKESTAHNTVTLGGLCQMEATGKLLWFVDESKKGYAACCAEGGDAYPGSTLRRSLMLTPRMLVDVYEVESDSVTQIDWLVHAEATDLKPGSGALGMWKQGATALGDNHGYQHLTSPMVWKAGVGEEGKSVRWDFENVEGGKTLKLGMWILPAKEEEVFSVRGIGYTLGDLTPSLVRRRHGSKTRFVTVYDLSGDDSYVKGVSEAGDGVAVETAEGKWNVKFSLSGVEVKR